jgi:hypothetical protein
LPETENSSSIFTPPIMTDPLALEWIGHPPARRLWTASSSLRR